MPLETTVVVDKLKEEGISETLANGLNFETEDELSSWVGNYKTSLPQTKSIDQYTKEELEELSKDPEFKGAKGLQSFIDSVRSKAKFSKDEKKDEKKDRTELPKFELPEDVKSQLDEVKKLREDLAAEKFEKNVTAKAKAAGLDEKSTAKILKIVKVGDTDEKIDTEIKDMKEYLSELGVKSFGTPGGGGKSGGKVGKIAEDWAKKEKARKEKFTKK